MRRLDVGKVSYFQFETLLRFDRLIHGAFGRLGGVSSGCYDSLNVSFAVGDDPENVRKNRRIMSEALSIPYSGLVVTKQIHGTNVLVVDSSHRPADPDEWYALLPDADGLITREPGYFPTMTFADCVPLVFYDPDSGALGLAHGGWKGTVAGIAGHTVRAMIDSFDTKPKNLRVGIGPSIGPCCYEVQEDVASQVRGSGTNPEGLLLEVGGGLHLDLWEMNRRQLVEAGVRPDNVELAALCTACNTDILFSNRAEHGRTGRFGVVVGLRSCL